MSTLPSLNNRGITLIDGVSYSQKSLCVRCHHPICSNYATLSCKDFTPALTFKYPIKGIENEIFNTFRIGKAWSKRVSAGSLVCLVETKNNTVVTHCKVLSVYVGEKLEMAKRYGKDNHTMQSMNLSHESDDIIAISMLERLRKTSGNMIYNSSDYVTVIYLTEVK